MILSHQCWVTVPVSLGGASTLPGVGVQPAELSLPAPPLVIRLVVEGPVHRQGQKESGELNKVHVGVSSPVRALKCM